MAIKLGRVYAWSIGGVQVEDQTDGEVSFEAAVDDVTTKDSTGNWAEGLYGRKSWSGSFSGLYDSVATEGADEAIDELIAGNIVTVLFTSGVASDRQWTGSAIITNVSVTAPGDGPGTYSVTFTGTGAPTPSDVSA